MNPDLISSYIPPKIINLDAVIPILMHFYSLISNWSIASFMKCDLINDVKLFRTVYNFDSIQSDAV